MSDPTGPRRPVGATETGSPPARPTAGRRRGDRRRAPIIAVLVVAVALIAVAVIVVARGVNGLFGGNPDYTGDGTGTVVVHIQSGSSLADIGNTLENDGVVESVGAFTDAASANSKATRIGPGYYRLHQHMSAASAIALLLQPSSLVQSTVVIPEGFTAADITSRIAADTNISSTALQAALKDPSSLGLPSWANGHVEGLLFPATYSFAPGTSATQALSQMIARFNQEAATLHLKQASKAVGLSEYDAVILASIVQNEGKVLTDYPKIAEVFLNRMHNKMPLGSNATLAYVLHRAPTTYSDLHTDSPYNTEFKPGLPPTPINSPGEAALQAVLHPTKGPWLYFVTLPPDGRAAFATTEAGYKQLEAEANSS